VLAPQNPGGTALPRRGYRKGVHDHREPVTHYARTRLPTRLYRLVVEDASRRRLTHSRLLRALLDQYYRLAPMPKASAVGASYAVARELNRIGVNLNQLVHLANAARLVPVVRLEELIDRIEAKLEAL